MSHLTTNRRKPQASRNTTAHSEEDLDCAVEAMNAIGDALARLKTKDQYRRAVEVIMSAQWGISRIGQAAPLRTNPLEQDACGMAQEAQASLKALGEVTDALRTVQGHRIAAQAIRGLVDCLRSVVAVESSKTAAGKAA